MDAKSDNVPLATPYSAPPIPAVAARAVAAILRRGLRCGLGRRYGHQPNNFDSVEQQQQPSPSPVHLHSPLTSACFRSFITPLVPAAFRSRRSPTLLAYSGRFFCGPHRHPDTMPAATTLLSRAGSQLTSRGSIALRGSLSASRCSDFAACVVAQALPVCLRSDRSFAANPDLQAPNTSPRRPCQILCLQM